MKKYLVGAVALILAIMAGIAVFGGGSASATEGECVPREAWTETIEHPAVTHEVVHPAVYETVHHEAVTHTEYHFAKFTRTKTKPLFGDWSDYGPWTKWQPETRASWELSPEPLGSPQFHGEGWDRLTKWYRQWQARHDGQTREVEDEAAWDEEVLVSEEWTETVVDEEAWTEVIEHPEVTCEGEQPDPLITETSSATYECGDDFQTVTHVVTTTEYVLDEEAHEWVLGEPVSVETVTEEPVEVVPCPEEPKNPEQPETPEEPKDEPKEPASPVKQNSQPVAVPTVVDSGL